jgi:hypothetical protein
MDSVYSRRDFGKLALAGLPLSLALARIDSKVNGVRIGVQSYSFRTLPLDDAIKANAEEPEFFAWRGYAKFFANPDKKAGHMEALKDLHATLKKNDRIASAHYFLGHIAKLTGDEKTALKEFKKTVDLNPDHIDAAREVRMMTSGKK